MDKMKWVRIRIWCGRKENLWILPKQDVEENIGSSSLLLGILQFASTVLTVDEVAMDVLDCSGTMLRKEFMRNNRGSSGHKERMVSNPLQNNQHLGTCTRPCMGINACWLPHA